MVRCRCGQGVGECCPHHIGRYRFVREITDRPAHEDRLPPTHIDGFGSTQPEQVFLAGAKEISCGGAVFARSQTTHHRHRDLAQFALDEIGGCGEFVGDGDVGDDQRIAVLVDRTLVRVGDSDTCGSDCHVGLSDPPGPSHRVCDQYGHVDAQSVAQGRAQGRSAGVRIGGEQCQFVTVDVGAVDARCRLDDAELVLGDQCAALAGHHPHRFGVHEGATGDVAGFRVGGGRHHPALDLRDDLAGHHQDVAGTQPIGRRCQRTGEVVTRPEPRQAGDRQDLDRPAGGVVLIHAPHPRDHMRRGPSGPSSPDCSSAGEQTRPPHRGCRRCRPVR